MNKVRLIIYMVKLSLYLWGEVLLAVTYLYNIIPYKFIGFKSLYKLYYNEEPYIKNIKIWGFICYYNINILGLKLKLKKGKAVFIGYFIIGNNYYKVWDFIR